ncbi:MAG: hypothetical protein AAGI66_05195 [Cyanobacteria bacterium P01_H01_bin.74]
MENVGTKPLTVKEQIAARNAASAKNKGQLPTAFQSSKAVPAGKPPANSGNAPKMNTGLKEGDGFTPTVKHSNERKKAPEITPENKPAVASGDVSTAPVEQQAPPKEETTFQKNMSPAEETPENKPAVDQKVAIQTSNSAGYNPDKNKLDENGYTELHYAIADVLYHGMTEENINNIRTLINDGAAPAVIAYPEGTGMPADKQDATEFAIFTEAPKEVINLLTSPQAEANNDAYKEHEKMLKEEKIQKLAGKIQTEAVPKFIDELRAALAKRSNGISQ